MADGVRIELDATDAIAALSASIARTQQPKELFDAIGAALVSSTSDRFELEKGPDNNPWPKSIRVQLEGGKTLSDSGQLRASITHEATETGVAVGTNVISAAVHQFGATIRAKNGKSLAFTLGGKNVFVPSVTIPARPFLGLSDDDELMIADIAGAWLLEPVGGVDQERVDG